MKRYRMDWDWEQEVEFKNGEWVKYEDAEPFRYLVELIWANKWQVPTWMKDKAGKLLGKREGN